MRAVVQRVRRAQVRATGDTAGEVGEGLCVLFGVTHRDSKPQIEKTVRKIAQLHVLRGADGDDDARRFAEEAGVSVFLASQFTLYANVHKGRSPGWSYTAPGDVTEPVVAAVAEELRKVYELHIETGKFGVMMDVEPVNDGPFILLIEA